VFSFVALFLLPAALIGVPAQVIAVIAPIQLFAQFWYHTRLIHKMGWLEYIIVTPSHHRVHHAINPEYIDKNYGQIFILWDKWFGTFQQELQDVPAVYGVKRPVQTWNPMLIGLQHVWLLLRDAIQTRSWKDKLRIWFMPTGWRPEDVKQLRPVGLIENVFKLTKFDTHISKPLLVWSWIQLGMLLCMTMYLFMHFADIGFPGVLMYGLFLFVSIFSMTSILDKASYALPAECIRCVLGCWLLFSTDIIGFESGIMRALIIFGVGSYLFLAVGMAFYFTSIGELRLVHHRRPDF
jgi:hypothetical protein